MFLLWKKELPQLERKLSKRGKKEISDSNPHLLEGKGNHRR